MIVVMNIRRMFLGMAVLCGFSVLAAAEGRFDRLRDLLNAVAELVEATLPLYSKKGHPVGDGLDIHLVSYYLSWKITGKV